MMFHRTRQHDPETQAAIDAYLERNEVTRCPDCGPWAPEEARELLWRETREIEHLRGRKKVNSIAARQSLSLTTRGKAKRA